MPSESPDFYRTLLEDSPQATLVYGPDHLCRWVSPGFARMASRPVAVYAGQLIDALWEDIHPDDRVLAKEAWASFGFEGGADLTVPFLFRMRIRSGDFRLVEVMGSNHLNAPLEALVLHFNQVVDRKRAEHLLLSERERLLVTLRSIGDGVIATDVEGRITLINSVTENLTEWTYAEAIGRMLPDVFHIVNEETGLVCENPVEKVFQTGGVVGLANHTALVAKSGRVSLIEDSAAPIRDSEGRVIGAILVFRDVTEARKTASDLLRMQKLESIGVLAGGIAHDFNNILTAILGNASLGTLLVEPLHPVQDLLTGIVQAARRASDLTQQLLTFSKGGNPVLEPVRVQDLIEEACRFLLVGSATEGVFDFEDALEQVMADPGQLGQVVQNLVLNASQAMENGGRLSIRGENVLLTEGSSPPLGEGRYVKLAFRDQGSGILPEHREKIFEPYFTTKPTGTGLGLAVVWSIVKSHRGWVEVDSRIGEGTTFTIWLPSAQERKLAPSVLVAHKGRALVMDDEADPRKTMVVMLQHLGYECCDADSGEAALDLLGLGAIDLAVVDLTVKGGMGGREVLPHLKRRHPQMKVIVTSGYSIDPVLSDYRGFGFDGVVRKPFTLAELTLAIDEAMGHP